MNGADSLVKTLLANDVEVCFTNPGTSEMHFVAALDQNPAMRCVLCLFEGVTAAAADGYARMLDRPAATLLHLGPGLSNAGANIHNARRARSPLVNIVGDHATYHRRYDAPLTSDIEAIAAPLSHWVRSAASADQLAPLGAEAVGVARAGQVATLILPADTAWLPVREERPQPAVAAQPAGGAAGSPDTAQLDAAAAALRSGERCLLLLGGKALRDDGLRLAVRLAAVPGVNAELLTPVSNARLARGAGRARIDRLPYAVDPALARLAGLRHAVLLGAPEPVAFFAYPDKPSRLLPAGCQLHPLAGPEHDPVAALAALTDALDAPPPPAESLFGLAPPPPPSGRLDAATLAQAVAAVLPEQAIVVDESISSGREFFATVRDVPPHDWLQLTGGAIGIGPPLAAGAATACPDRPVLALQADGSAMYTVQALWTQARESLDVTTVILANRAYAILQGEMRYVGANPGRTARDLMDLDRPALDWVKLAAGQGVAGERVDSADDLVRALRRGLGSPGPYLIEALL